MKKNWSTILLYLVMLVGLFLLLYPPVSDYWNSFHQSRAITSYNQAVAEIDNTRYEAILNEARQYNRTLLHKSNRFYFSDEDREEYNQVMNPTGSGIIGTIEIPEINLSLPIYHGTGDAVLQIGVGHIEGSSLPVGGPSSHVVLSGHRGLPSAKLFTDLDDLVEGDRFLLRILDETLTYEVEQVLIVEPTDMSSLEILEGQDLCTLVTCTPYGINTHRLLVRGHRVENDKSLSHLRVLADAVRIEPLLVAAALGAPMLLILFILLMAYSPNRDRKSTSKIKFNPFKRVKERKGRNV